MLLLACDMGCAEEAMIISAMLSIERVFYSYPLLPFFYRLSSSELRSERGKRLQRRQQRFVSDLGDHFTYLNVYVLAFNLTPSFMKFRNHDEDRHWCEDNGLHYRSLRTAVSIYKQLRDILVKNHTDLQHRADDMLSAIQSVIARGCCLNLARRCANDCYRTLIDIHENGGTRIGEIHPSSALVTSDNLPRYIVFQEVPPCGFVDL